MTEGEIELRNALAKNRLLWIYCTGMQARDLAARGLWDISPKSVISVDLNKGAKEFLGTLLPELGFVVGAVHLKVVDYEHLLLERWEHIRRAKEADTEAQKKRHAIKSIFLALDLEDGYDSERVEETLSAIRFVSCFSEGLARIAVVDSVTKARDIRTSDFKKIGGESYSFCKVTIVGTAATRKIPDSAARDVFESFTIDDTGRMTR